MQLGNISNISYGRLKSNKPLKKYQQYIKRKRKGGLFMRLPKIQNYKNEKDIEVVKLKDIDKATRDIILITEKEKVKFIKTAERIIRSSQEYKDYITYL